MFEPYTKDVFDETIRWIADHGIFAASDTGACQYEESIVTLLR